MSQFFYCAIILDMITAAPLFSVAHLYCSFKIHISQDICLVFTQHSATSHFFCLLCQALLLSAHAVYRH